VCKSVLKREIQQNLYSLRFFLSLVLILVVFIAGSLSFVRNHAAGLEKYREAGSLALKAMEQDAARNATALAVERRSYDLRPRDNAFLADAKEKHLPNSVIYSAWNVFGFENKGGSANPFLARYDELGWTFIASVLVSFIALLFTFDAVSGEKETRTLSLTLSHPVPRGTLISMKYLSAVFSSLAVILPGVLVSLLILLVSGAVSWSWTLGAECLAVVVAAGFLAAAMAAVGLVCSVLARSSNVSLLLALSVWLLFGIVIPNSSSFLAKKAYPIETSEAVQKNVQRAFDDLNKNAPPGSWMSQSGNPFLPQHELRANLQRKRMAAEKAIRDAYYRSMFRQFEKTRRLTAFPPRRPSLTSQRPLSAAGIRASAESGTKCTSTSSSSRIFSSPSTPPIPRAPTGTTLRKTYRRPGRKRLSISSPSSPSGRCPLRTGSARRRRFC